MKTNPYEAPKTKSFADPGPRPKHQLKGRVRAFGYGHLIVFAALWLPFTILVFLAVSHELDDASERPDVVAYTTLASITGPMVGAISRGGQGCCLQFSLSLLPYGASALVLATATQLIWRPKHWLFRIVRLLLWASAWLVWFGSGIFSFAHALS